MVDVSKIVADAITFAAVSVIIYFAHRIIRLVSNSRAWLFFVLALMLLSSMTFVQAAIDLTEFTQLAVLAGFIRLGAGLSILLATYDLFKTFDRSLEKKPSNDC